LLGYLKQKAFQVLKAKPICLSIDTYAKKEKQSGGIQQNICGILSDRQVP
jgi:hypothetical protein